MHYTPFASAQIPKILWFEVVCLYQPRVVCFFGALLHCNLFVCLFVQPELARVESDRHPGCHPSGSDGITFLVQFWPTIIVLPG